MFDGGIGIESGDWPVLFEPFVRTGARTGARTFGLDICPPRGGRGRGFVPFVARGGARGGARPNRGWRDTTFLLLTLLSLLLWFLLGGGLRLGFDFGIGLFGWFERFLVYNKCYTRCKLFNHSIFFIIIIISMLLKCYSNIQN